MISVDQTSSKIESKIEEKEARLDIRLNKKTKDKTDGQKSKSNRPKRNFNKQQTKKIPAV